MSALLTVACERVPLLAPSGSTITLTALATALPTNGSTDLIAQVIESGGTPPHSGTLVTFTTSIGTVQPSSAETDVSGRVQVKFLAGTGSGTATITAISGGVSASGTNAIKILVGAAAVGRVIVSANPTLVPALGGTTAITAVVLDINGNPLSSVPVSFSTTAGSLANSVVNADQNGQAQTTLTTAQTATVTASVGATAPATTPPATGGGTTTPTTGTTAGQASGTVTVGVVAAPTLVITPPTTSPSAGLPATFSFVVTAGTTNGSAVRDLSVNWGDGSGVQDLGAVTGTAAVTHVFRNAGTYVVTGTVLDASGNKSTVSTTVTVIPVPRPTIIITPSPVPGHAGAQTTLQIQVTLANGISVQDLRIDFGDGQSADLGGASSASVPHVYTAAGTYTVTVTVLDTTGQVTTGTTAVSISGT
ncbi:MAG TPA: PKD domain-containing protein [Vicinamibacterales bacterium]|nr:PKD domain-containing protein [Vicinamibacterales bacterium]